jgi:hypothetical protein
MAVLGLRRRNVGVGGQHSQALERRHGSAAADARAQYLTACTSLACIP